MKDTVASLLARTAVYMLIMAGMAHLVMLEGYSERTSAEYSERSLTEWLQIVSALVSGICFLVVAWLNRALRPVAVMLAALTCTMFIREADFFLDARVFDGAWQVLVTLVFVAMGIYLWRQPDSIADSVRSYSQQPSSGILLSGILVTFVYSRLFGHGEFWQAVMGDGYQRVVKNIAEEGTEMAGYCLFVIAALELVFVSLSRVRIRERS